MIFIINIIIYLNKETDVFAYDPRVLLIIHKRGIPATLPVLEREAAIFLKNMRCRNKRNAFSRC
jgi:hypothetical protein